ncbi:hypothetical protein CONPUDRAFT_105406 [Coniophora puteana RWD-64-598 SS2]|uniref:Nab2 type CCCH zinc finger 4 domain-containing protein n=1 Tax=Coniophora puteana (strain RWD-64-598) TaxID=741705 RepID=A0A5M3MN07_CONPW|nr:uncharacterized protein CONPUDRAFT_105406 [Coniophora puteana RWD-64-598 SS2]EIW80400.1 hypothetical protein CONPUDRAFT_105406 [Coniophora puteana RWD-64-598 SS2]
MAFGLVIGTERATNLQNAIQDELMSRGYSPDADPVMAEYITIMIINNKTAAQITSELEDLIGSDYDASFTDWLFTEAAKGAPDAAPPAQPAAVIAASVSQTSPSAPKAASTRPIPQAPRSTLSHALNQAVPSGPSGIKRPASGRSPSPSGGGPNKSRRTDLPTGPRAMQASPSGGGGGGGRSLLDRMGPRNKFGQGGGGRGDDIQARIDSITNGSGITPEAMMMAYQNGMLPPGMDMNAMNAVMAGAGGMNMNMGNMQGNQMMLQEMMMNQMALMAQMASSMGLINGQTGQFSGPAFGQDGNLNNNNNQNGFQNGGGRGRGGMRGRGRGRGGHAGPGHLGSGADDGETLAINGQGSSIAAPQPIHASPSSAPATLAAPSTPSQPAYALPARPGTPTLCKFGTKCTNALCRYSHPSPVASAESGVVLSSEACEAGKDCQDKDCVKGHVSKAAATGQVTEQKPPATHAPAASHPSTSNQIPCRFGTNCTRPGCSFAHPPRHSSHQNSGTACRFGSGCTRATCTFSHPPDRVLPGSFHRGLDSSSPSVKVNAPGTGTMSGSSGSMHKSAVFNTSSTQASASSLKDGQGNGIKAELERQMKDLEAKKEAAQKAMMEAQAAASSKTGGAKDTSVAA